MEDFQKIYEQDDSVNMYLDLRDLQKPEQTILDVNFSKIKDSVFLDVGIGTGRTTYHFANITQKYIGTDIAKAMIDGAKTNFKNDNLEFLVCDARYMSVFSDNTFDVVYFSFNGIDYINIDERILFFNEVKRICKKDALLVFSTHNLLNIKWLFDFKFSLKPIELYGNIIRYFKLRQYNKNLDRNYSDKDVIKINDGAHGYGLQTTYIKPEIQKQQLQGYGFTDIKCYGSKMGIEIDESDLKTVTDPWIYFSCLVNS